MLSTEVVHVCQFVRMTVFCGMSSASLSYVGIMNFPSLQDIHRCFRIFDEEVSHPRLNEFEPHIVTEVPS